jgi:hypothetical protein
MTDADYLKVVWTMGLFGLAAIIAATVLELVGRERVARWLRLDIAEDDE